MFSPKLPAFVWSLHVHILQLSGLTHDLKYLLYKPGLRDRRNKNEFNSGLQPSEQGPDVDTPPLRDGAEIIRAFSPFGQWSMVMRGTRRIMYPANNH